MLTLASPASAAPTRQQKLAMLDGLTQPAAESFDAWNEARQAPSKLFIWETDGCTVPEVVRILLPGFDFDRPLGYDFRPACERHDFGYRNYASMQAFDADTKSRLDDTFYADMERACEDDSRCLRTAALYYKAVTIFG